MSVLETIGLVALAFVLIAAGFIAFNHYQYRQWLKDEWKRRNG